LGVLDTFVCTIASHHLSFTSCRARCTAPPPSARIDRAGAFVVAEFARIPKGAGQRPETPLLPRSGVITPEFQEVPGRDRPRKCLQPLRRRGNLSDTCCVNPRLRSGWGRAVTFSGEATSRPGPVPGRVPAPAAFPLLVMGVTVQVANALFPWHDRRATTDDTEKRAEDEPRIARINTDKKDR
jgi:hypothetical protein